MANEPTQYSTTDGTLNGPVNGSNKSFVFAAGPEKALMFNAGLLETQPTDGNVSGFTATYANPPLAGTTCVVEAWSNFAADPPNPPLNAPRQFTTWDGSILGAVDGSNNVFTLNTTLLVTQVLLWWQKGFLTQDMDFTWATAQNSSAGGWTTTITLIGGNIPQVGDILTAEVFLN